VLYDAVQAAANEKLKNVAEAARGMVIHLDGWINGSRIKKAAGNSGGAGTKTVGYSIAMEWGRADCSDEPSQESVGADGGRMFHGEVSGRCGNI